MRGCQKRVIYMKNTGSEVFEEAYFVVKDESALICREGDLLSEAKRIVEESSGACKKSRGSGSLFQVVLFFGSGFLLAFLLSLLLFFAI